MVIMLHLKVFLLPRKDFFCFALFYLCACVCVWCWFGFVFCLFSFSLSLLPFSLVRVKMMSWMERKCCSGIDGKARVRGGNYKRAVYNISMNWFKNTRFQEE